MERPWFSAWCPRWHNPAMEHQVRVYNRTYQVAVYQKSKTVWIAVGEYEGARIEVKGRSEGTALSQWREAARYRGN